MKKLTFIVIITAVLLGGCVLIEPGDISAPQESASPAETAKATAAGTAPSQTSAVPGASETPTASPTATAEATPEPTDAPEPVPLQIAEAELKYENEIIDVDIIYPVISGMQDAAFEAELNARVYGDLKNMADSLEEDARADRGAPGKYYIQSVFTVRRNEGVFLSIEESVNYYGGGASTGSEVKLINAKNTLPGEELSLENLFSEGADYTGVLNDNIEALIAADPYGSDYSFTGVRRDQGFYLTDDALVIVFQRYDIAPGTYGEISFTISLAHLAGVLADGIIQQGS